jgi:hypothetical protein
MDRGLVGVLLICLIASTLVAFLFFGLAPAERVTLIRLEPFDTRGSEKVHSYVIELLVREPIENLEVQFSYLLRVDEEAHEELRSLMEAEGLLEPSEEALLSIPKVEGILEMEEWFENPPSHEYYRDSADYKDLRREVTYDLAVLDLHDFFRHLPDSAGPGVFKSYFIFASVFHEENVSFYQGVADYYLNREESLGKITYEREGESHLYENPNTIVPKSSEFVHIYEAPRFGTISFNDLGEKETVKVLYTTRHVLGPGILVARVFVNGELDESYYSFFGWPEAEYP